MQQPPEANRPHVRDVFTRRALLLLFGLGVLAFLVAIDRADWFSIRPASGSSLAMSHASAAPGGDGATRSR